jgi:hypothetical protein
MPVPLHSGPASKPGPSQAGVGASKRPGSSYAILGPLLASAVLDLTTRRVYLAGKSSKSRGIAMNAAQKKVVAVAVVLFILMGLFPPWLEQSTPDDRQSPVLTSASDYAPIFLPPPRSPTHGWRTAWRVDTDRLTIQWAVLAMGAVACFAAATSRSESKP